VCLRIDERLAADLELAEARRRARLEYMRKYRALNRERIRTYNREYQRRRRNDKERLWATCESSKEL